MLWARRILGSLGREGQRLVSSLPDSSHYLWALSLSPQEDNHNYYVSRVYGPGEKRSQDLWVDLDVANPSQVRVHRVLSSSHRQASVSA